MSHKRLAVAAALAILAAGRLGSVAFTEPPSTVQAAGHKGDDQPIIRRDDDEGLTLAVVDDLDDDPDTGDGDATTGDDGTNGGDNTGDGDATTGDDGTNGGDNDATTGDDGTNGGDNTGDSDATTGDDGTND
jgi:hypothetical protein